MAPSATLTFALTFTLSLTFECLVVVNATANDACDDSSSTAASLDDALASLVRRHGMERTPCAIDVPTQRPSSGGMGGEPTSEEEKEVWLAVGKALMIGVGCQNSSRLRNNPRPGAVETPQCFNRYTNCMQLVEDAVGRGMPQNKRYARQASVKQPLNRSTTSTDSSGNNHNDDDDEEEEDYDNNNHDDEEEEDDAHILEIKNLRDRAKSELTEAFRSLTSPGDASADINFKPLHLWSRETERNQLHTNGLDTTVRAGPYRKLPPHPQTPWWILQDLKYGRGGGGGGGRGEHVPEDAAGEWDSNNENEEWMRRTKGEEEWPRARSRGKGNQDAETWRRRNRGGQGRVTGRGSDEKWGGGPNEWREDGNERLRHPNGKPHSDWYAEGRRVGESREESRGGQSAEDRETERGEDAADHKETERREEERVLRDHARRESKGRQQNSWGGSNRRETETGDEVIRDIARRDSQDSEQNSWDGGNREHFDEDHHQGDADEDHHGDDVEDHHGEERETSEHDHSGSASERPEHNSHHEHHHGSHSHSPPALSELSSEPSYAPSETSPLPSSLLPVAATTKPFSVAPVRPQSVDMFASNPVHVDNKHSELEGKPTLWNEFKGHNEEENLNQNRSVLSHSSSSDSSDNSNNNDNGNNNNNDTKSSNNGHAPHPQPPPQGHGTTTPKSPTQHPGNSHNHANTTRHPFWPFAAGTVRPGFHPFNLAEVLSRNFLNEAQTRAPDHASHGLGSGNSHNSSSPSQQHNSPHGLQHNPGGGAEIVHVDSTFNNTETAARVLFAILNQHCGSSSSNSVVADGSGSSPGHGGGGASGSADLGDSKYSHPDTWVRSTCGAVERSSVSTSVLTRHLSDLESKLMDALDKWNPDRFLNRVSRGFFSNAGSVYPNTQVDVGGDETIDKPEEDIDPFFQKLKCFRIPSIFTPLKNRLLDLPHHTMSTNCQHELKQFVYLLSANIITRMLQGQRVIREGTCPDDFITRLFTRYGGKGKPTACPADTAYIPVEGLQSILDDAMSLMSRNCSSKRGGSYSNTRNGSTIIGGNGGWITDGDIDSSSSSNTYTRNREHGEGVTPGESVHSSTRWEPPEKDEEHEAEDLYEDDAVSERNLSKRSGTSLASTSSKTFTARQVLDIVLNNRTKRVSRRQFYQLCPALLQQVLHRLHKAAEDQAAADQSADLNDEETRNRLDRVFHATPVQTYGLGTAAVTVITLCSLLGAVFVRCCKGVGKHYAMAAMIAMAVGNLCGDAILHLLPEALGIGHQHHGPYPTNRDHHVEHDQNDDNPSHHLTGGFVIDDVRLKCLALLGSVYLFWLLEIITCRIHDMRRVSYKINRSNRQDPENSTSISMTTLHGAAGQSRDNPYETVVSSTATERSNKPVLPGTAEFTESSSHLAWLIVVGDAVHNLVDGLAIGAAFAHSVPIGLSTSLAVVCHEIPHEIGDFAVLISTGMKVPKALFLNLLSALTAFVGLYVGIAVGTSVHVRQWMFVAVAGMFLYISLANLIPEMVRYYRHFKHGCMFLVQSFGMLSGFGLMLVLVIVEDKIHF